MVFFWCFFVCVRFFCSGIFFSLLLLFFVEFAPRHAKINFVTISNLIDRTQCEQFVDNYANAILNVEVRWNRFTFNLRHANRPENWSSYIGWLGGVERKMSKRNKTSTRLLAIQQVVGEQQSKREATILDIWLKMSRAASAAAAAMVQFGSWHASWTFMGHKMHAIKSISICPNMKYHRPKKIQW